jgi:membrane protease YdiL (CAAX protease family)
VINMTINNIRRNLPAIGYCAATLLLTFFVGQVILWAFPGGNSVWSSVLFILMNLVPMIMAYVFSRAAREVTGPGDFLRKVFVFRERPAAYLGAVCAAAIYYGVSLAAGNVKLTGAPFAAVLIYLPWTLLQGGLEEVGWRWYLQPHLRVGSSFMLRMVLISAVWFIWHFPIYRLPWITAGSSNYLIFYLMILGNTFILGAVRQLSKGAVPCIIAHMLIDSLAVLMLVQSDAARISVLAATEIVISLLVVRLEAARRSRSGA